MTDLNILVSKPTIEVPVVGFEMGGAAGSITVGFKRHNRKEAEVLLRAFSAMDTGNTEEAIKIFETIPELKKRFDDPEDKYFTEYTNETIVPHYIEYIKDAEVDLGDGPVILNTRDKDCPVHLKNLIDVYLNDTTYYVALVTSFARTLQTYDFEEAQRKNFKLQEDT